LVPYYRYYFIFFISHYREDNKEQTEALTDKIQAAINQSGILPPPFLLALEEITIISGTKTQLSSSSGMIKVLYNTQT
jgi:hypothetical protein